MTVDTFVTAGSVDEAARAMALGARPVAGGTDLVVGARQGKAPLPTHLVAIHRIDELHGIGKTGGAIRFGALTTHADVVADRGVREQLTALADASAIVGSHATRAQGTLGGNLMNASPAMETGGPFVCFDAIVTLHSVDGSRELAVAELFAGPGKTIAEAGELLTEITVPAPRPKTGSCYLRLEYRRQMEIAVVGVTAVVTLDGGQVKDARIAMTALAPTIRRVPEAEFALIRTEGKSGVVEAATAVASAASPISDVRASHRYRRAMAEVIAQRAIEVAVARACGATVPIPASPNLHGGLG